MNRIQRVASAGLLLVGLTACNVPTALQSRAATTPASVTVDAFTTISRGGTPGNPLVIDGRTYRNGLRIVANDVVLRNSTVQRPGSTDPALYLMGDRITVENVTVAGPAAGSEGLRIEGGDRIVIRGVTVPGLQFVSSRSHSDALQVYLQRPLTNLLIEGSTFDGTVHGGDPQQLTANGSQIDGARGPINGTIRNVRFLGGKYYSARYYNISGPLYLAGVSYRPGMVTNSGAALVVS